MADKKTEVVHPKRDQVITMKPAEAEDWDAREEEKRRAKDAMEHAPEHSIMEQHTGIPVGANPETARQKKEEDKLKKETSDELVRRSDEAVQRATDARSADNKKAAGEHDTSAIPKPGKTKDWKQSDFRPVRLLKGYVPLEAYSVIEGQSMYIRTVPVDRTHDKIQPQSVIGLPLEEAKKAISAGVAERADELR